MSNKKVINLIVMCKEDLWETIIGTNNQIGTKIDGTIKINDTVEEFKIDINAQLWQIELSADVDLQVLQLYDQLQTEQNQISKRGIMRIQEEMGKQNPKGGKPRIMLIMSAKDAGEKKSKNSKFRARDNETIYVQIGEGENNLPPEQTYVLYDWGQQFKNVVLFDYTFRRYRAIDNMLLGGLLILGTLIIVLLLLRRRPAMDKQKK